MKNASVFIFPSLEEGFGIPPVEAMAYGIPVAASRLQPMTEVLGKAALFFNPLSPEDISRAMLELIQNESLREKHVKLGKERVLMFKSEVFAQNMLEIFEDAGRKKTLCISSEFPPITGGISTHVHNLWKRLPAGEIIILTAGTKEKTPDTDKDLDVICKPYPLGGDIFSRAIRTIAVVWHTWRLNNVHNIKCNHCAQVLSAGLAGLIMKKMKGTRYVTYVYSADILEFGKNFITRKLLKKILKESRYIIANSNFTRKLIRTQHTDHKSRTRVSTPAVDTHVFDKKKGEGSLREKYGIPPGTKVILTVSRLAARKGHDNIIKALSKTLAECPDTVYVIVGEGESRAGLEELAKEHKLEKNVIFTGEVRPDELVHFYNMCDVFVMVPRYLEKTGDIEGFGIVFLEASACGKPVIGGNTGGVPEAILNGKTGILVPTDNVSQISAAMLLLLKNEAFARKLGENGLLRVAKDFNWDSRVRELKELM
ncbi:MAG: glycosyltransferase [Candidatus Omnitrophica bacterium]|nr:glycosyltransferase [Candidatus Omnitrophota bacterium]